MKRARQVRGFLSSYVELNHEAPTLAQIGAFLGFRSLASVVDVLIAMERFGMIERTRNWRGITLK